MKCPLCDKGKLVKKKSPYAYGDIYFGEFDSEVCTKCNEIIFTEEAFDAIESKAKDLGVWGLGRKTKLAYAGNSLIVRIPKDIVKVLKLDKGKEVLVILGGKKRLIVDVV